MTTEHVIAIDIGTSGIRAQSYDLNTEKTISTAITLRHPLPGANVVDHLHFAMEVGRKKAHELLIGAINKVITNLECRNVKRISVCGNPIQLSLFSDIEIRDLAFWGKNALKNKNIKAPSRRAKVIKAKDLNLEVSPDCEILIPPAIKHEIGADALAMLYKSGALNKDETSLIIDFGTNAEMALIVDSEIYTASAAAGPAIEGQSIEKGRLASPNTICDIKKEGDYWRCIVLDEELNVVDGDLINPKTGEIIEKSDIKAEGITGTGVIAAYSLGLEDNTIHNGKINDKIHLQDDIYLTQSDILNIAKALGAFRAGELTLCETSDCYMDEIDAVYMAGASSFYVDAIKSLKIGQIPPSSENIYQIGNTSLAMALDIAVNPTLLDELQSIADDIESNHIMLATSDIFEKIYSLELSLCEEGMPFWKYEEWLDKYDFQTLPPLNENPKIHKLYSRDISSESEKPLKTIDISNTLKTSFDNCIYCMKCVNNCPENALSLRDNVFSLRTDLCSGLGCLRCMTNCSEKAFKYNKFYKGQ